MTQYPPEFEQFYSAYPRQVEKRNAYLTWKRLTNAQQKEVIDCAKNYSRAMRSEQREVQYIKHAKVFLNPQKEIWKDYLQEPKKASDEWLRKKLREEKNNE